MASRVFSGSILSDDRRITKLDSDKWWDKRLNGTGNFPPPPLSDETKLKRQAERSEMKQPICPEHFLRNCYCQ